MKATKRTTTNRKTHTVAPKKPIHKPAKTAAAPSATVFNITKPKLAIAMFDVTIAGDRLLVDRIGNGAVAGYGETAVDNGGAKPLPISREQVFERAKYRDHQGVEGFPAGGIRAAIRDAAVVTDREIAKAAMNRAMTVLGDVIPLGFRECQLREDIGRNSGMNRSPRLVIRPMYIDWELRFQVRLMLNEINPQQLYSLITLAGQCIGIGNWRPGTPKGGSFGCWEVKNFALATGEIATAAE